MMRHLSALMMLIPLLTAVPADAQAEAAAAANPQVVLETSKGTLVLELYRDKAPKTVASFLAYVESGFYDGTIFHRVIPDFMVQGGGFTPDMRQKPTRGSIDNEADNGLQNVRGTVAMARTNDPHSATAQFFVNTVDNDYLNHKAKVAGRWGYTVFGKVVEGMEAVDTISAVKTRGSKPIEPVVIEKASVKGE